MDNCITLERIHGANTIEARHVADYQFFTGRCASMEGLWLKAGDGLIYFGPQRPCCFNFTRAEFLIEHFRPEHVTIRY